MEAKGPEDAASLFKFLCLTFLRTQIQKGTRTDAMLHLLRKSLSLVRLPTKPLLQNPAHNHNNSNIYKRTRTLSSLPSSLPLCPGCGVHMQNTDTSLPGFFLPPSPKPPPPPSFADDASHLLPLPLKSGLLPSLPLPQPQPQPQADPDPNPDPKPVVCARCHSLRHYSRVKDLAAEALLPDFDLQAEFLPRIASSRGARSVVLAVVDASDFDGSFPRRLASMVASLQEEDPRAWKEGRPGNVPRLVVAASKIDLLPQRWVSPTGLDYWVRQRAREGGAGRLAGVHLVSSVRGWGVRNLLEHLAHLAGPRGNVWAVGAQNAGKSTLINAMGRLAGGNASHLTEAPVPGTTLGFVRVDGVLRDNAKLFDTPGILHPYQLSTRLTREEQRLVHIGKELRPRTYRVKAGHTIHIAGLMRLDVERLSRETIYVTVWASPLLPLHMGKTENACKFVEDHFGRRLQPPIGDNRVHELGKWVRREFHICGKTWNASAADIAAAGLGWFAICLNGEAILSAWTYDGIDVVLRSSLVAEKAKFFEVAGFTVSKILSEAESALGKPKQSKRKKAHEDAESPSSTIPSVSDTAMGTC